MLIPEYKLNIQTYTLVLRNSKFYYHFIINQYRQENSQVILFYLEKQYQNSSDFNIL